MLESAHQMGCDEEQIVRFIKYGYIPLPRALEFHKAAREVDTVDGQAMVGYGGPRGEAKSHAVIAQVALDDCYRMPGLKCLYLRKIKASAKEQLTDLTDAVIGITPKNNIIRIGNGSTILIGGFRDKTQLNSILGLQYDVIITEDATTFDDDDIKKIRGSCRTSKPDWKPRLYMPTNPGGIGHAWYKKIFWDTYQVGKEINTRFIWARPGDNPFIDKGYREYLDNLTGWLRQAWRDGDFSIAAGQFFTTFDVKMHVVKPFYIDPHQIWWASMDYGFIHWNIVHLFARLGQDFYVVDEIAVRRQLPKQNAISIHNMLERSGLEAGDLRSFCSGHDVFAKRGTEHTIAEQYEQYGIELSSAKVDRINGAARVLDLLGNPKPSGNELEIPSRLFIFVRCKMLMETLPTIQHVPNRGEDVLKVDCNSDTGEGGDDAYDNVRYGLMEDIGDYGYGGSPTAGYRG